MHERVANPGVPPGRVIVVDPLEHGANHAAKLRQVRLRHGHQDARVEEEHEDHAVCDSRHDFRVGIVSDPCHQVNRELLQDEVNSDLPEGF